jgi:hypothetical protein
MTWTDRWSKDPDYTPGCGGPEHWWRSDHVSGYSVGETDAGRYMACDNRGNGFCDLDGEYLVFSSGDAAKEHVETLLRDASATADSPKGASTP